MKKLFFSVTLLIISLGGLSFGENYNAEGLSEVKTQGIEVSLNSREVTSYVFNHYPPSYYKGKRLIAKQYLGQGQYRGYYN